MNNKFYFNPKTFDVFSISFLAFTSDFLTFVFEDFDDLIEELLLSLFNWV